MQQERNDGSESIAADDRNAYKVERVFIGSRTAEQVVADLIKVHANGNA